MTVVKGDMQICPPHVFATGLLPLMGDGTGTGWALRRRLIQLLSAGWLPHFRNSSWAIPV
jgi:hypothetical protein